MVASYVYSPPFITITYQYYMVLFFKIKSSVFNFKFYKDNRIRIGHFNVSQEEACACATLLNGYISAIAPYIYIDIVKVKMRHGALTRHAKCCVKYTRALLSLSLSFTLYDTHIRTNTSH